MPELPEVETIVRGLNRSVSGRVIDSVRVFHPRTVAPLTPLEFEQFLKGVRIEDVLRFGKYIHFVLDEGRSLIVHLRMTGKFVVQAAAERVGIEDAHTRVLFILDHGERLYFQDARIFGTLRVYGAGQSIPEKDKVGIEPFSDVLTGEWLHKQMKKRTLAIKQFLLDQKVIAGIGNIYAAEVLFYAGIDPALSVKKLSVAQCDRLVSSIKMVLEKALKHNGTSIRDFRSVDEKSGEFQNMLMVYGRKGEPCRRCGAKITTIQQGQRTTFFCPLCQRIR